MVAIFGRLTRWKGQHILLQAARLLPGVTFWLVGDALFTEDDRELCGRTSKPRRKDLRGIAYAFLGFREDIPELMQAADIVAHCSTRSGALRPVLVEAMLAGNRWSRRRPGGPKEIVEDGVTGFLTPPGEVRPWPLP